MSLKLQIYRIFPKYDNQNVYLDDNTDLSRKVNNDVLTRIHLSYNQFQEKNKLSYSIP